tara:strand:+ start:3120 stop:4532 length:1413 start_codon:yes stop_codon:yes gene_type:complete
MTTTAEISTGSLNDTDGDSVADLTRPGQLDFSYNQSISTEIREPVVFSDTFARWNFDRQGFLSHTSRITFSVTPPDGVASAFFPVGVGIGSLIDRVVLKGGPGGATIAETQEFGSLMAYDSMFVSSEANKEREQYLSARMMSHASVYETDPTTHKTDVDAPTYGLDNGRSYTGADLKLLPFSRIDGTDATTVKESPVYSILLGDLVDLFKNQDFPLYLCDDEIHLELHFQTDSQKRVCQPTGGVGGAYKIDQSECRMIYDTIYYDGEQMDKFKSAADRGGGLTYAYTDYRLTKRTATSAATWANLIQNVGGAGRFVDKVIVRISDDTANKQLSLLNSYQSEAPTTGETTLNIRYNDRFEFPIDRSNTAMLFQTLKDAQGEVPFITRQEFSRESPDTITARTFELIDQRVALGGKLNFLAVKPSREERINNQGIDLIFKGVYPGTSMTLLCWLGLRKVARIENGALTCYFA